MGNIRTTTTKTTESVGLKGTMNQTRQTNTEHTLKEAFITLVQTKGFDAIGVSDICRTANINRSTFYAHYSDKFDLRLQLFDTAIDNLKATLTGQGVRVQSEQTRIQDLVPSERILKALSIVSDNKPLFTALLQSGNGMEIFQRIKDLLADLLEEAARLEGHTLYAHGIERKYGRDLLTGGITTVIWHWMQGGFKESPSELTKIIDESKDMAPTQII